MNHKKIPPELRKDVVLLFRNFIPIKLIATVFSVNIGTIIKYIPQSDIDDKKDFSENGNDLRLHLLKLYAWLVADEKDCVESIGTLKILELKSLLHTYLSLSEYERYIEGVQTYKCIVESNSFVSDVPEGYRRLINTLYPKTFTPSKPSESVENALRLMHKGQLTFPTKETINKPAEVFAEYIEQRLAPAYGTRSFGRVFVQQLQAFIESRLQHTHLKKEALEAFFGISGDSLTAIAEKQHVGIGSVHYLKNKALELLKSHINSFYNPIRVSPVLIADQIQQCIELEKILKQKKISQEQNTEREKSIYKRVNTLEQQNSILAALVSKRFGTTAPSYISRIVERSITEEGKATFEEIYEREKNLDTRLEDLDFSVRTFNCLKTKSIETLRDLVLLEEEDLRRIRNFGQKSFFEVEQVLFEHGLNLGMNV